MIGVNELPGKGPVSGIGLSQGKALATLQTKR